MIDDYFETTNLAQDPAHAERLAALQAALRDWRQRHAAPDVTGPNPGGNPSSSAR